MMSNKMLELVEDEEHSEEFSNEAELQAFLRNLTSSGKLSSLSEDPMSSHFFCKQGNDKMSEQNVNTWVKFQILFVSQEHLHCMVKFLTFPYFTIMR